MVEQMVANHLAGVRFSLPATRDTRKLEIRGLKRSFRSPASRFQHFRVVDKTVDMCVKDISGLT